MGREKQLRQKNPMLCFRGAENPSLHQVSQPPLLRKTRSTNLLAMTNTLNQNYPPEKSRIFPLDPTAEKSESETETGIETESETETEKETKKWTETESFHQTLKGAVGVSITPEAGAIEVRTVDVAEAAGVEVALNILTESPEPALTCPLLEALLLFVTERRVKHGVKVRIWKLCPNADDGEVQTQTLKVKEDESLPVTPDPLTESPAPSLAAPSGEIFREITEQGLTSLALVPRTWETEVSEGRMMAGQSQDSFPKESRLVVEEGGCIAEEVGPESAEVLALPLFADPHETRLLSGPLNLWRPSGLRMRRPHPDMTILQETGGHQSPKGKSLWMEFLRAAERGLADHDQPDPRGKTNHLASGG